MKIAALIQAHHRPEQLRLLLTRLDGQLWSRFVHVDKKVDLKIFSELTQQALFLGKRVRVNWGGASQIRASILLIREALSDANITHFYLMSGQCYPVKSDEQIASFVKSYPAGQRNFASLQKMPVSHKPIDRFTRFHAVDIQNILLRKIYFHFFKRLPDRSLKQLRGIDLYGGSSWWLMERSSVEKIIQFIDANSWYLRAFKYSACADEMFFQSLIVHLGIKVGGECPTATKWMHGKHNPEIVTEAMHNEFCEGPKLFARKYVNFHPSQTGN